MANLTVVIESDTLKRARMRALEEGTSVNAIVRDYLADYAGTKAQKEKAITTCCSCPSARRPGGGIAGGSAKIFTNDKGACIP